MSLASRPADPAATRETLTASLSYMPMMADTGRRDAFQNATATHLANPMSRRCLGGLPSVAIPLEAFWATSKTAWTAKELRSTRAHRSGVRCGAIPGSCWNASLHSSSTCTAAEHPSEVLQHAHGSIVDGERCVLCGIGFADLALVDVSKFAFCIASIR